MKQLLFTLVAIGFLLSASVHGQNWCPSGATWIYSGGDPMIGPAQLRFTYAGDTLVDGYAGQRIEQLTQQWLPWWAGDSLLIASGPDVVTRTEPGVVLWWLSQTQEWDTLYWFGAQLGDMWSPGWEQLYGSNNCTADAYLQVVDTGTMIVDGVPLRTLDLDRHRNATEVDLSFTIMERAGNTLQYFFPDPPYICFINEALQTFGCYSDDEIHYPPSTSPCELTLGVTDAGNLGKDNWSISPVPFRDRFAVQTTYPQQASTVSLLDMTGRELLSAPFRGTMLELDASGLPSGIYLLRLLDGQGRSSHRKVIKE